MLSKCRINFVFLSCFSDYQIRPILSAQHKTCPIAAHLFPDDMDTVTGTCSSPPWPCRPVPVIMSHNSLRWAINFHLQRPFSLFLFRPIRIVISLPLRRHVFRVTGETRQRHPSGTDRSLFVVFFRRRPLPQLIVMVMFTKKSDKAQSTTASVHNRCSEKWPKRNAGRPARKSCRWRSWRHGASSWPMAFDPHLFGYQLIEKCISSKNSINMQRTTGWFEVEGKKHSWWWFLHCLSLLLWSTGPGSR